MSGQQNRAFTGFQDDLAPGAALIGYARVSTEDQKLDLQRDALTAAGVEPDRIYEEYISGAKTQRPQLVACLKALRAGDILVVWRLDRLGRRLRELAEITEGLERRGIGFRSLHDRFDTTTAGGRLIFHVMAAIAEFERNLISERTIAGLNAARLRGHRGGRPMKISPKRWPAVKATIEANPTETFEAIAAMFDVSRSALYRTIEKYAEPEWRERLYLQNGRNPRKPADA